MITRTYRVVAFCFCLLAASFFCPPCGALDLDGYASELALVSGGLERTYDVYAPPTETKRKRPLVVVLHGYTGSAKKIMKNNNPNRAWLDVALCENFIVAIPNGLAGPKGFPSWNDCRKDNTRNTDADDLAFIKALIQTLIREHQADPSRVYVTGTSNGGHMSLRLALEAPDIIAAAAPIVAAMPQSSECKPMGRPVSILFINGTYDPILPYGGSQADKNAKKSDGGTVLPVEDSVAWWVRNNGADTDPVITKFRDADLKDGGMVLKYFYPGPAPVALIKVTGGGHTEPSLSHHYGALYRLIVDGQNRDFETAEEVWQFFKDKAR